jgi:hypothetical protein
MSLTVKKRDRLLDSTLEFIAYAPEQEFEEYLRDTRQDARTLADTAKAGIAAAQKAVGARKRATAKERHKQSVAKYGGRPVTLPATMKEKLAMLASLIEASGNGDARLSLQHRDLKTVPEEELDRLLTRLIQLTQSKK